MEVIRGETFSNSKIDLTGKAWPDCKFVNCTLVWNAGPDTDPANSVRSGECTLEGNGWPLEWFDDDLTYPG